MNNTHGSLRAAGTLAVVAAALALGGCLLTTESVYRDSGPEVTVTDGGANEASAEAGSDGGEAGEAGVVDGGIEAGMGEAGPSDGGDVPTDNVVMADATDGCVPTPEVCDGVDNDCNGTADDNIGLVQCGVGACMRQVLGCVDGGVPACTPGQPSALPDTCDGQDNDCDGQTDEDARPVTCGLGACAVDVGACSNGRIPACTPMMPGPTEICGDMVDNDCNGLVDEGCGCDIYVLRTAFPTGADGSALKPFPTIMQGITAVTNTPLPASGFHTVCVGATPNTAVGSTACVDTSYAEQVTLAPDVHVLGGFRAMVGSTNWPRDPRLCHTIINDTTASGVLFTHTTNDNSVLDGFTINAIDNGDADVSAVLMQSCGWLSNNVIVGGNALNASVGVDVSVPIGTPPASCTRRVILGNKITAGAGGTNATSVTVGSFGIRSRMPVTILDNPKIVSGSGFVSAGIELLGVGDPTPGNETVIGDNQLISAVPLGVSSRNVGTAAGILVAGAADNVDIVRNGLVTLDPTVSTRGIHGVGAPNGSSGILILSATTGDTTPITVLLNGPILGGSVDADAAGIAVSHDSSGTTGSSVVVIGANESIVGKDHSGGGVVTAGVACNGPGSKCFVAANTRIVGYGLAANSLGGNSTGGGIIAAGGAQLVALSNQGVTGCEVAGAKLCVGISADSLMASTGGSVPNVIDSNVVKQTASTANTDIGVFVAASSVIVSNNMVTSSYAGIDYEPRLVPDGYFVANTSVVNPGSSGGSPFVEFHDPNAGAGANGGAFVDNIAMCTRVASNTVAFFEFGSPASPLAFFNNDLTGCGAVYFDSPSTVITDINRVNALTDILQGSAGNISVDPSFASMSGGIYRLGATSPVIDQGDPVVQIGADFEGDLRPQGQGYDIGADEFKP